MQLTIPLLVYASKHIQLLLACFVSWSDTFHLAFQEIKFLNNKSTNAILFMLQLNRVNKKGNMIGNILSASK
jgi:hypothetical protein